MKRRTPIPDPQAARWPKPQGLVEEKAARQHLSTTERRKLYPAAIRRGAIKLATEEYRGHARCKEDKEKVRETALVLAEARKTGRPPTYHECFCDQAFKHMILGFSEDDLAFIFDVDQQTIDLWCREHPSFLGAVTEGRRFANGHVAMGLYQRAVGFERESVKVFCHDGEPVYAPYTEYYPPDPNAAFKFLANRDPERWKNRTELTGTNGTPLVPPTAELLNDLVAVLGRMATRIGSEHGGADGSPRIIDAEGTTVEVHR